MRWVEWRAGDVASFVVGKSRQDFNAIAFDYLDKAQLAGLPLELKRKHSAIVDLRLVSHDALEFSFVRYRRADTLSDQL